MPNVITRTTKERSMSDMYEHKAVKIPMNKPRARTKILDKFAKDNWELVDIRKGGLFAVSDLATLRRIKRR